MNELRCCICIGLDLDELPPDYLSEPLTIINGNVVCQTHGAFAGPNRPMAAWINAELAHGRHPKGAGPA